MAASAEHRGFELSQDKTELRILFNGSERMAIDATGVSFNGSVAPAGVADITGNTSAYAEALLIQVLTALAAVGIITDSTTT